MILLNDSTSFIGGEYYRNAGHWSNGVLAKDGNIYACPYNANQVLQIHIENQTTHLVGPHFVGSDYGIFDDHNRGKWVERKAWSGFVEGTDGFLYDGIPDSSDKLLRFDPLSRTATLIPMEKELRYLRFEEWSGGISGEQWIYLWYSFQF